MTPALLQQAKELVVLSPHVLTKDCVYARINSKTAKVYIPRSVGRLLFFLFVLQRPLACLLTLLEAFKTLLRFVTGVTNPLFTCEMF